MTAHLYTKFTLGRTLVHCPKVRATAMLAAIL